MVVAQNRLEVLGRGGRPQCTLADDWCGCLRRIAQLLCLDPDLVQLDIGRTVTRSSDLLT